jgi:hypothetical protein
MKTISDGSVQVTFFFVNGRKLSVEIPKQAGTEITTAMSNLKKVLESDRIMIEADGDLLVIPVANLTHFRVHPAPEAMPGGIIRGARVISDEKNKA